MKNLFLVAAALTLSVAAMAGPTKAKKTPENVKCAVKGEAVNVKDATAKKMFADYKGNRYFFCCAGCPAAFKADPAHYAKADHIATPKAEKPAKKS